MPENVDWEKHLKEKTGAKCGNCGCDLTFENDAGGGFCRKCQEEIDSRD